MAYLIMVLLVIIDQITKYFAKIMLYDVATLPIFEGILHLTYVENRGIAFGMFQNMNYIIMPLSVVIVAVCLVFLHKEIKKGKKLFTAGIMMVISGAVGNIIDRIARGYVVDFIHFKLIDFPVFNFADILVCVGMALVILAVLFFDKGE